MIFRKVDEIVSGVRDTLHVLARVISDLHKVHQEQIALRATLDQLLLQQQRQMSDHSAGLAALLGAEVETEQEAEERKKLEEEYDMVRDILAKIEEV